MGACTTPSPRSAPYATPSFSANITNENRSLYYEDTYTGGMMQHTQTACRTCGTMVNTGPPNEGIERLIQEGVWCSPECMDKDPKYLGAYL